MLLFWRVRRAWRSRPKTREDQVRTIKQSSAYNLTVCLVDNVSHVLGLAGASLNVWLSKNGGAFSPISPTITERVNGWYNIALTTGNTDTLGDLSIHIEATGADPVDIVCQVVAGSLDADVTSRLASASYTAPDNASITTIKGKTDALPASPAAVGSAMSLISDYDAAKTAASASGVAAIPTNPLLTSDSRLNNLDATISTRALEVGGNVASIKAKTDTLPASPATTGSLMNLTSGYDAAKTAASSDSVARALGLLQENVFHDQLVYDGNGRLTGGRRRLYSNALSVGTDSNVLATYTITVVWNLDETMQSYKAVKI